MNKQRMSRFRGWFFIISLSILTIVARAQQSNPADGNWYFHGFKTAGDHHAISSPVRFDGTAAIGQSGIQMAIGGNSESLSIQWNPTGSGYYLSEFNQNFDQPNDPIPIDSTLAKVVMIDDQTALFFYGKIVYHPEDIIWDIGQETPILLTSWDYQWISGVLTRSEIPVVATPYTESPGISGKYKVHRIHGHADNYQKGIKPFANMSSAQLIGLESGGYVMDAGDDDSDAVDFVLTPNSTPGWFSWQNIETAPDHLFTSIDTFTNPNNGQSYSWRTDGYNLNHRDEMKAFSLGDGRIFLCEFWATLGYSTQNLDNSHPSPSILFDSELSGHLAIPEHCGVFDEVSVENTAPESAAPESNSSAMSTQNTGGTGSMVRGDVTVVRNGQTIQIKQGDLLFEGDLVTTSDKSFIQIKFIDGSQMNVAPNSSMRVEKFTGKDTGVIDFLKGKIRAQVIKDYPSKTKLFIKNTWTTMGVRGTTFDVEASELNGQFTTLLTMIEGTVEATNLITHQSTMVTGTETWSVTAPIKECRVTLQAPTARGSVLYVNGDEINTFPTELTVPWGTELHLQAEASEGRRFYRWLEPNEQLAPSIYTTILHDEAITCEFLPVASTAEDDYLDEALAAGLDGEDAATEASPHGDGVANLTKYAFGMNLAGSDVQRLVWDQGTSGLPAFRTRTSGNNLIAELQFLRRTDDGLIYRPLVSTDCIVWRACSGPEQVVSIGNGWERVTVSETVDSANPSVNGKCGMFRMEVRAP